MELQRRFAEYQRDTGIQPGALVCEKPGLGHLYRDERDTHVFMLWRLLNMDDPIDQAIVDDWVGRYSVNRLDCIIAYLSEQGEALIFEPHERAQLMPAEEAGHG